MIWLLITWRDVVCDVLCDVLVHISRIFMGLLGYHMFSCSITTQGRFECYPVLFDCSQDQIIESNKSNLQVPVFTLDCPVWIRNRDAMVKIHSRHSEATSIICTPLPTTSWIKFLCRGKLGLCHFSQSLPTFSIFAQTTQIFAQTPPIFAQPSSLA